MEECAGFGWRSPLRCRRVPKLETLRRFDDADNRITEVETSADGAIWHTDANYTYYPHGPLARVELGEHKVQGIDYAYTLQGWLKGINGDLLSPTTDMGRDGDLTDAETANDLIGRDAYAMSLGYYGDEDYKAIGPSWGTVTSRPFAPIGTGGTMATEHVPLYNGNIAHTVNTLQRFDGWSTTSGPAQILAMVYRHDQLNRLKQARGVAGLTTTNTWHGVNDAVSDRYKSAYWHDANGNLDTLARFDGNGQQYDGFKYAYHTDGTGRKVRNRLYNIREMADQPGTVATDIPHIPYQPDVLTDAQNTGGTINTANLYGYDVLGQRVRDNVRGIEDITWSATGKMKVVDHTTASGKPDVFFSYDAGGTRILKQVGEPALNAADYREHYVHDAQGNIMAIYRYNVPDVEGMPTVSLKLTDRPLYGSSRLGSLRTEEELHSLPSFDPNTADPIQQVDLNYDLTDHLGNVATVVTGRLLDGAGAGSLKQAEVVSATLHEPFGMDLTGMNWQSDVRRFGFQNQLRDLELGFTHFKYREYGADGSGFLSVDPLAYEYPYNSPYAFSENRVIEGIELEGLEVVLPSPGVVFRYAVMKKYDEWTTDDPRNRRKPEELYTAARLGFITTLEIQKSRSLAGAVLERRGIDQHKGTGNAVRHAFGQAHATARVGFAAAKALADAHEGIDKHVVDDHPEWVNELDQTGSVWVPAALADQFIDQLNNSVGRQIGEAHADDHPERNIIPDLGALEDEVMKAHNEGRLFEKGEFNEREKSWSVIPTGNQKHRTQPESGNASDN